MSDSTVPSKPASESKRVKFTAAGFISVGVALLTFLAGLAKIPFIGQNKWIVIVAGIAGLALMSFGSVLGIMGSGTKIVFGGKPEPPIDAPQP